MHNHNLSWLLFQIREVIGPALDMSTAKAIPYDLKKFDHYMVQLRSRCGRQWGVRDDAWTRSYFSPHSLNEVRDYRYLCRFFSLSIYHNLVLIAISNTRSRQSLALTVSPCRPGRVDAFAWTSTWIWYPCLQALLAGVLWSHSRCFFSDPWLLLKRNSNCQRYIISIVTVCREQKNSCMFWK